MAHCNTLGSSDRGEVCSRSTRKQTGTDLAETTRFRGPTRFRHGSIRAAALVAALLITSVQAAAQKTKPLSERVDLYYDAQMMPHVIGESDEAAFYGLGVHHMREFPIGTLNTLWLSSGRMAEVAGESYLDEDRLIRLWEVPAIADRHARELAQAKLWPLIRAYVRGVEDGRAWWRMEDPALSTRLDALLGPAFEMNFDRVPDFMNPVFSPFGGHGDPQVPEQIRRVVDRLFSEDMPITESHVVRLGVVLNSFFLLRGNAVSVDVYGSALAALAPPAGPSILPETPESLASNGWMISPPAMSSGRALLYSDGHVALNKLQIRPYMIQIRGRRYDATGISMPGYPGVYAGYNDSIAWLVTALPSAAVARNRWEVVLEASADPDDLRFHYAHPGGSEEIALERIDETLFYFDTQTAGLGFFTDTRFYVPVHSSEHPDLGFERYPVPAPDGVLPGETITFEQAAFTSEGSPWHFTLGMGRARSAGADVDRVLDQGRILFGNGLNLMVADASGSFRYEYMGRYPVQGAAVVPDEVSEQDPLEGHDLASRWQGYHGRDELPSIGPADVTSAIEVWSNNNVTPDRVEAVRFDDQQLANYPAYMVSHSSVTTWRQERVDELLAPQLGAIDRDFVEREVGYDRTDLWMRALWPFFESAQGLSLAPDPLLDDFLVWMNEYRSMDENDVPNAAFDFVAHTYSRVTLYGVILRSHYESELERIHADDLAGGGAGLTPEQLALGVDPLHPLFVDPSGFDIANYGPNVDAMLSALEDVAALWELGDHVTGLRNQTYLEGISPLIAGDPWSDARYGTQQDARWAGIIAGSKLTRWGHVNMTVLTPHYLRPPKSSTITKLAGIGAPGAQLFQSYLFSALDPPSLQTLSFTTTRDPFYAHDVVVRPIGGVRDALFFVNHKAHFQGTTPKGYTESLYDWGANDTFAYHPQTAGSQTLFLCRARGRESNPERGAHARRPRRDRDRQAGLAGRWCAGPPGPLRAVGGVRVGELGQGRHRPRPPRDSGLAVEVRSAARCPDAGVGPGGGPLSLGAPKNAREAVLSCQP